MQSGLVYPKARGKHPDFRLLFADLVPARHGAESDENDEGPGLSGWRAPFIGLRCPGITATSNQK